MEGPSLVLLSEEMEPFLKKKVQKTEGPAGELVPANASLKAVESWGKHLILRFDKRILRIHFLMFGSYRINEARERDPRLHIAFPNGFVNFYSCSVKEVSKEDYENYDWSIDLMSEDWDQASVLKKARAKGKALICDLLMDQTIFAGLGNIIKNEVLFRLKLHPDIPFDHLSPAMQKKLVIEARRYSLQFYQWKKINQLKRNWLIFRKRKCRDCGGPVLYAKSGVLQRVSFFCPHCQPKDIASEPIQMY